LLLIAAEEGNAGIVNNLLELEISTVADDEVSAQDLAWKNRHSDVLIILAQANLPYPEEIDMNQLSDEFKAFYKQSEELHVAIISKNEEKVKNILKSHKNLEFYFDLFNKSAARVAIDVKAFNIYEILLINEIFLAPHEYEHGVFDDLEYEDQRLIRELHHKHSKDLPDKHINILMTNSSIAHDVQDADGKLRHIKEAYKLLSQNQKLNTILKVVAASKNFHIIYDFNRDAVNIADPTVSGNTEGVFYVMGRIYIGSRQLLDESTKSNAIATLAHELCHYAVNLVYSNMANPYENNDHQTIQEFEEINEKCQKLQGKENVVDMVHEYYPVGMHHAELIVRPAHLIALYLDQPEKLKEAEQTFPESFGFFDKVIKDMKAAIPDIERREKLIIEKKDQKISKLRKKLVLSAIFSVIGIFLVSGIVGYLIHKPFYSFKDLSPSEKSNVKNGTVSYKNIEVRFSDLFADNSTAYNKLSSDHITQIFNGQTLDFSNPHLSYLNDLVHHDWENLAGKLKQKILTSNFSFQNESLKFDKLNPVVLDSLTSDQIVDVLDQKELKVGKIVENKTKFYVERKFVFEGQADNLGALKYFNIYESMDEVIYRTDQKRFFVLSSEAGAGKTVTFEQLAMRIKREFPSKWVSYVELKNYTNVYDNFSISLDVNISLGVEVLLEKILGLSSKNEFERKIFDESYKSGNVIILWNGFDEISPTYSKFIIDLMQNVFRNSQNIQYVCTRPLYSKYIQENINFHSYQLIPFNENEQKEFLTKLFTFQNVSSNEIENIVIKVQNVSKNLKFSTPLMLKLISEVHDDQNLIDTENFYKIYEKFVSKKVKIWQEKSEFAQNLTNILLSGGSGFDIMKIYQKYALINIFSKYIDVKKLQIMKVKIPKGLPLEEISRMGILYINTEYEFEFAHRTFVEFFVAQYFIQNFYLLENERKFDENVIILFNKLKFQPIICKFISNFIDSQAQDEIGSFSSEISTLLRHKYEKIFLYALNKGIIEMFEMYFKFFNKDHDVLLDLLKIDEDETLYTATFNPEYVTQNVDPQKIKEIANKSLTSEEFSKFLSPKNQKGKILFGIAKYKYLNIEKVHDEYSLGDVNVTDAYLFNIFDILKPNLTKIEQKEFLKYLLTYTQTVTQMPSFKSIYFEDLWENNINLLSVNETKLIIGPVLNGIVKNVSYLYPAKLKKLLNFTLTKTQNILSDSEVFDTFKNEKVLQRATVYYFFFDSLWKFFVTHTTVEQQRDILMTDDTFRNIRYTGINGTNYLSHDYTPFKIFHFSLFNSIRYGGSMIQVGQIYEEYFNRTEIQKIILNSNEFMIRVIRYADKDTCEQFFYFLKRIFVGNENALKEFLARKIDNTDYDIFDYFDGLSDIYGKNALVFMDKE